MSEKVKRYLVVDNDGDSPFFMVPMSRHRADAAIAWYLKFVFHKNRDRAERGLAVMKKPDFRLVDVDSAEGRRRRSVQIERWRIRESKK